jgi:hypothetical protein
VEDERLLHRALEAEVELLERLSGREAGLLDPRLAAVGGTGGDLLDLGLGRGAAQRAGVLERRDRAVAGERASVAAGELARVEAGGQYLALRHAQLDTATDRARSSE